MFDWDEDNVEHIGWTVRGDRYRIVMARDASDREYDSYVRGQKR